MKNLFSSFRNAFNGFKYTVQEEVNMKIHLIVTIAVFFSGLMFRINLIEWTILLLTISMVLFSEMINTSIERAMDYIENEHNEKIGVIKDVSAGAVFVCSIFAAVIGLIIFLPYFSDVLR